MLATAAAQQCQPNAMPYCSCASRTLLAQEQFWAERGQEGKTGGELGGEQPGAEGGLGMPLCSSPGHTAPIWATPILGSVPATAGADMKTT